MSSYSHPQKLVRRSFDQLLSLHSHELSRGHPQARSRKHGNILLSNFNYRLRKLISGYFFFRRTLERYLLQSAKSVECVHIDGHGQLDVC